MTRRPPTFAANTRRGYEADLDDFEAYCVEHRVPALPAAPAVIAAYLAVRADRTPVLALATLARRLAAIRKVHDRNGYRGLAQTRAGTRTCSAPGLAFDASAPGSSRMP